MYFKLVFEQNKCVPLDKNNCTVFIFLITKWKVVITQETSGYMMKYFMK